MKPLHETLQNLADIAKARSIIAWMACDLNAEAEHLKRSEQYAALAAEARKDASCPTP